jgi:serine/threonine protein kinase
MIRMFGKYELLERMGSGGQAEVFRAKLRGPEGFEKQLALKLILPEFSNDLEFTSQFFHEAKLCSRLEHANIVRVQEFDQIQGRYYIAMELVDGVTLSKLIVRAREVGRKIAIPEALLIAVEIAKGLAFAHGELSADVPEIVHRDLSPQNIMLSRTGEVKITDFGIAKVARSASYTRDGTVKGKPSYMSPEQATGRGVDGRSDLFSFGVVLWELLALKRLFHGGSDPELFNALQNDPIPLPSTIREVPPELDQVIMKMLDRNRETRMDSAAELARQFNRLLAGYPDFDRTRALAALYSELFPSAKSQASATKPIGLVSPPVAQMVPTAQVSFTVPITVEFQEGNHSRGNQGGEGRGVPDVLGVRADWECRKGRC